MRAKILGIISVLEEKGNQLREPYTKHLDDGIFEVRGRVGTDITRVLYFFYYGKKIIITNGFVRKTQETPKREIKLAKTYRKDYLERVKKLADMMPEEVPFKGDERYPGFTREEIVVHLIRAISL